MINNFNYIITINNNNLKYNNNNNTRKEGTKHTVLLYTQAQRGPTFAGGIYLLNELVHSTAMWNDGIYLLNDEWLQNQN